MGEPGAGEGGARGRRETGEVKLPPVHWDDRLEGVLADWHRRVWASQIAHYRIASKLRRYHVWLGIPVVVISTIVGTSIFATLQNKSVGLVPRILAGSISVLAAVLASVQTFFRFAQRGDQHALAADWFSAIRRKIEEIKALPDKGRGDARKTLDDLRREINTVSSQFPAIGEREWSRVAAQFGIPEPPGGAPAP